MPTHHLPSDVAYSMFGFLDLKSLRRASQVSKTWQALANADVLWALQLMRYSEGHLWRYLFQTPDARGYQRYFADVFLEPHFKYDNFSEMVNLIKQAVMEGIKILRTSERIKIVEQYFEQLEEVVLKNPLPELVRRVGQLSVPVREQFLTSRAPTIPPYPNEIIAILFRIYIIDALLTDLVYLAKFALFGVAKMKESISLPANRLLSTQAMTVMIAAQPNYMFIKAPLVCSQLLQRLSEHQLVECAIASKEIAEYILEHPTCVSRLRDDNLLTVFRQASPYRIEEIFPRLLENNVLLLNRFNAEFMIRFAQGKKGLKYPSTLILTHPILIHRLNEEQCVEIASHIGKYDASDILMILTSEAFKSFTLKLPNPRQFLLCLPSFVAIYELDWTAALVTPEDALTASKRDLLIAEKVAKHAIFFTKFSQYQLLELALERSSIALILLQNKDLIFIWTDESLNLIEKRSRHLVFGKEIITVIHEIKKQQIHHQQTRQQQKLLEEAHSPHDQSTYEYTHQQLGIRPPVKPMLPLKQITTPPAIRPPRAKVVRPRVAPPAAPVIKQSPHSMLWPIAGLVGLGLLFTLGVLLSTTGAGAVFGVPLMLSTFTALNIFHISLEVMAMSFLLTGVLTTLLSANLLHQYSMTLLKTMVTLIKENKHQPIHKVIAPAPPVFHRKAGLALKGVPSPKTPQLFEVLDEENEGSPRFKV